MKRSHVIALGATGIIVAGVWLGRAGNKGVDQTPKDAAIYASVEECIRAGVLGSDICEAEFRKAAEDHLAAAPKFANQQACETQYGASQCRPATIGGSSVFVPAMVGFMVANYLSSQRRGQPLLPPNAMGAAPCPPGVTPAMQPGCLMPRQASNSSSSSSSSSSSGGWRSYSTTSGSTVSRTESGNGVAKVPGSATSTTTARSTTGAPSSHSTTSSSSSSSSTTSRGGFGSTGHSTASSSSS